jgi:hypothetical protein
MGIYSDQGGLPTRQKKKKKKKGRKDQQQLYIFCRLSCQKATRSVECVASVGQSHLGGT